MSQPIFTPLERQVIALAAVSAHRECGGEAGGPAARLAAAARRFVSGAEIRPLANPRLEALRRLACAAFASGGRAGERIVRAAREAGLTAAQIDELARMASPSRAAA